MILRRILIRIKYLLAKSRLPPSRIIPFLNGVLAFGRWSRQHPSPVALANKFKLYHILQTETIGSDPIDYLEFGVFRGRTFKAWLALNKHPDSRFVGFDTFEGLPEDWSHLTTLRAKGVFDAGGETPKLDDSRATLVKGTFQETLDSFQADWKPRHRLVVHCDADLYSSTLYVLTMLNRILVPGTIIIFDEFFTVGHEFQALLDWTRSYRRSYRILATSNGWDQVALEITA